MQFAEINMVYLSKFGAEFANVEAELSAHLSSPHQAGEEDHQWTGAQS